MADIKEIKIIRRTPEPSDHGNTNTVVPSGDGQSTNLLEPFQTWVVLAVGLYIVYTIFCIAYDVRRLVRTIRHCALRYIKNEETFCYAHPSRKSFQTREEKSN